MRMNLTLKRSCLHWLQSEAAFAFAFAFALMPFDCLCLRHNFDVHKAVMVNGLAVPLHVAGQLSDGYLFDPRSSQAFEYTPTACSACVRVRV